MITTLLLAEEHDAVGEAMRGVIASDRDLRFDWDLHAVADVLRVAEVEHPELLLLSHSMLRSDIAATVRAIKDRTPHSKIVVLSAHNDSRFALRAIEAGASGYLLQDRAFAELANAVSTVMADRTYLSPGIAGMERSGSRDRPGSIG